MFFFPLKLGHLIDHLVQKLISEWYNQIFPLLFFKDLGRLTKASMLSVACIPVILFVMIARGFFGPAYTHDHDVTYAFVGDSVLPSIGIFDFLSP